MIPFLERIMSTERKTLGSIAVAVSTIFLGCSDDSYPVERCEQGQGIVFQDSDAPIIGHASAPIEVVLFGDLKCPYTKKTAVALDGLVDELTDNGDGEKVKILFHHFPRADNIEAQNAALALAAAQRQGNHVFWLLFWQLVVAPDLSYEQVQKYAEVIVPDFDRFQIDLSSQETEQIIDRDVALASKLGFTSIPGVVICGVIVENNTDKVIENIEYLVNK